MSEMVLISIHPRFAEAIVRGEKTVEFRRRWTKREVSHLVIYATAPVKQIVAIVAIEGVVEGSPASLWNLSKARGGGVSKAELANYFLGLDSGFGIRLGPIRPIKRPIDPFERFEAFRPPQSFRFLTEGEAKRFGRMIR